MARLGIALTLMEVILAILRQRDFTGHSLHRWETLVLREHKVAPEPQVLLVRLVPLVLQVLRVSKVFKVFKVRLGLLVLKVLQVLQVR
jgi:hypothetical protein